MRFDFLSPWILAGGLIATTAINAQEPVSPKGQEHAAAIEQRADGTVDEDAPIFDDDGGRVFIVTRGDRQPAANLRFHGGEIVSQPRQVSLFLGDGWTDPEFRAREDLLSGRLAALEGTGELKEMEKLGLRALAPSLRYEQP